ncbi:MAG: DUF86 domain-containing protein [Candidatus Sulfobium sp.]
MFTGGALLYYLYLLADSCVSLAEMVIKKKSLRIPQSYQEAFDILGEGGVLEPAFAFDFAKIAGFRNFLAHDYEKMDMKPKKHFTRHRDTDRAEVITLASGNLKAVILAGNPFVRPAERFRTCLPAGRRAGMTYFNACEPVVASNL